MTDSSAGWHPDPEQPGQLRYWDGNQWTEHRSPAPPPAAATPVGQQMAPMAPPPVQGGYGAPVSYGAPTGYGAGGTPFVANTPPPSSNGCLKVGIVILIVMVVLGAIAVVGVLIVGHKVAKSIDKLPRIAGAAPAADYSYKITSCTVANDLVTATGTFTNRADRDQAYVITVDDGNGGDGTADIPTLSHGNTTSWIAEDLGPPPASGKPTCTVTAVEFNG